MGVEVHVIKFERSLNEADVWRCVCSCGFSFTGTEVEVQQRAATHDLSNWGGVSPGKDGNRA